MAGAVAATLASYFGTHQVRFQMNSLVTGTTHYYKTTDELVHEVENARVYGGMHFRNSVEHGVRLGKAVAKWIEHNALERRAHSHP